jgi:hypothetical protein
MTSEALFHLPTAPPRLVPPSRIWVPRGWRLLEEERLFDLSEHHRERIDAVCRQQIVGLPWLLVSSSTSAVPAPPEMFLRALRDLNVNDDEALARWCGEWGIPSVPAFLTATGRDPVLLAGPAIDRLPGGDRPTQAGDAEVVPALWPTSRESLRSLLTHHARRASVGVVLKDVVFRLQAGDFDAVPLSAARFAVGLRQVLTELFLSVPRSPTAEDLQEIDATALGRIWAPTGMRPIALAGRPHPLLESLVLGLEVLNAMAADAQAWTIGLTNSKGAQLVERKRTVGDVLAIELAKFLAENAAVKHCERCGALFVRQTGRARHNQHRTTGGVRYCTLACSQAAQSKAYRDRRAGRRATGGPESRDLKSP